MKIEKVITLKIISFDLDKNKFENLINYLNKDGFSFKLSENPCYGFQDDKANLRINLFAKNKVDFVLLGTTNIAQLQKCAMAFLDNAALFFKAISLEFGRIYTNPGDIKTTFVKHEFSDEDKLKFKVTTEIKSYEDESTVLFVTNYHFYNFKNNKNNNNIAEIIKTEILDNLQQYIEDYEKTFEG